MICGRERLPPAASRGLRKQNSIFIFLSTALMYNIYEFGLRAEFIYFSRSVSRTIILYLYCSDFGFLREKKPFCVYILKQTPRSADGVGVERKIKSNGTERRSFRFEKFRKARRLEPSFKFVHVSVRGNILDVVIRFVGTSIEFVD